MKNSLVKDLGIAFVTPRGYVDNVDYKRAYKYFTYGGLALQLSVIAVFFAAPVIEEKLLALKWKFEDRKTKKKNM